MAYKEHGLLVTCLTRRMAYWVGRKALISDSVYTVGIEFALLLCKRRTLMPMILKVHIQFCFYVLEALCVLLFLNQCRLCFFTQVQLDPKDIDHVRAQDSNVGNRYNGSESSGPTHQSERNDHEVDAIGITRVAVRGLFHFPKLF